MKGLLFTYAMTYGGAIVSLFYPFYGLLIYVCFAIVKPEALWHWSVPAGNYSRVIGIAFLLGWALHGFGDRSLGKAKPIVVALLGYWLWVALSASFALDTARGLPIVEYLAKIVLPFVAGITLIHSWRQLQQLMWVVLGSCAYLALEANMAYLGGYSIQRNGFIGMDNNGFSILMATGFGLALVLGFEDPIAWRRYTCFGIAAAFAHVPMLSMSRGGMLATLVAAGVGAFVIPKTSRSWLMICAAVVIVSMLAGPSVIARFSTSFVEGEQRDDSAQSRLDLWRACIDETLKHPLFGVGTKCWPLVVESYGWPPGKEAHSLWFETAAELGIPGVTFLILFYFRVITCTWRAGRNSEVVWMPMLARMTLVSLTGFLVSASFVTVEGFEFPYYVALLGACGVKIAHASSAAALAESHADELMIATDAAWQGT
jgi:O-antigen ligase